MNNEVVKRVPMKDYYLHRKEIQKLYRNDCMYGDLAGALLGVRESNKYIDSMSLEIQDYRIRIELVQGKNDDENREILSKVDKIFSRIGRIINTYIVNNIDRVTDEDTAKEIVSNIDKGHEYYDISHIGNMVEITL